MLLKKGFSGVDAFEVSSVLVALPSLITRVKVRLITCFASGLFLLSVASQVPSNLCEACFVVDCCLGCWLRRDCGWRCELRAAWSMKARTTVSICAGSVETVPSRIRTASRYLIVLFMAWLTSGEFINRNRLAGRCGRRHRCRHHGWLRPVLSYRRGFVP